MNKTSYGCVRSAACGDLIMRLFFGRFSTVSKAQLISEADHRDVSKRKKNLHFNILYHAVKTYIFF